ncbi:glycerophosphoryl diester phosphodiesterase [Vibrio hyugaensis]|uniref:glycerophosphoryl diester phosphodiesterase n=1 Tax=Vibrio hyugaensis TaxID=1534743 RepID=UPI003DA1149A
MKITAHRGLSSLAPENTLSAMQRAIEFGCEWIEIDVQLSADNIPMIIHDKTVNRCTNGQGKVKDLTWHELRLLDAGLWFGDDFAGEYIPTLEETLELTVNAGVKLNIELKIYSGDEVDLLCEKVAEVIERLAIKADAILFSSFNIEALMTMKNYLPEVRRGQLWQEIPDDFAIVLQQVDAYSVHCDYRFLNEGQAKRIKQFGYRLFCYTPNFPQLVASHWLWGVDMMITDTPQRYKVEESKAIRELALNE